MTKKMSVDTKVYDLAVDFLSEVGDATDKDIIALAQEIQTTVEDFIATVEGDWPHRKMMQAAMRAAR